MCAISAVGATQYVLYDFSKLSPYAESTTKWSIVRVWGPIGGGTVLGVNSFICIGTIQENQQCMRRMAENIDYIPKKQELVLLNSTSFI